MKNNKDKRQQTEAEKKTNNTVDLSV